MLFDGQNKKRQQLAGNYPHLHAGNASSGSITAIWNRIIANSLRDSTVRSSSQR